MSGDNMILLTPLMTGSILGVEGDDAKFLQLNILRHLIKHCTTTDQPEGDDTQSVTSTPVRQKPLAMEDDDHISVLVSVVTAVTDCVALGLTEDEDPIIDDLLQCKRPAHPFFSEVYKKSNENLPAEVLATFCDVSVVKFFSRCNACCSQYAVEWCLQYLLKMFSTLDPLLQSTGSGWYNAKVKARKASSIARAPLFPISNDQVGGAEVSCVQNEQPRRRKSGCTDLTKVDMKQLTSVIASNVPEPSLDSYAPPATSQTAGSLSTRSKRAMFKPPSMVTITEEPPDIISSTTIDMSIVRFSPDLTEPCNYGNDPLVCMPQPDSLPSSPVKSNSEVEFSRKKCVRFDESDNAQVNLVDYELQWGVSSEGRIGLIAILSAISKLPVKITRSLNERITGRPYDCNSLWNEMICAKVFKLIQKCINSSMFTEQDDNVGDDTSDETSSSASYKRRAYRLNRTKPRRSLPQRSLLADYCSYVMHFAFQALIQCALFIRCSAKSFCPKQAMKHTGLCSELHEKLSRICSHSGTAFKKYLQDFVKDESVEKVLAFLHAVLGFCAPAIDDDKLGNRYEHKVKIVVSVVKSLMDRMLSLDLTESSMKTSITYEACRLVTYSLDLLSEETFDFVHQEYPISLELKKYIMYPQRLVLSTISPIIQSNNSIRNNNKVMSGSVCDEEFVYLSTGLRLWNNLPIDELKLHVERFVVLMYLSEPGTIPSAGFLASIIDMTSLPVLVRAAVLFECAIFVNRIRNGWFPASLEVNCDGCRNVLIKFKQWGEAIGSKLEELEESDEQKMNDEEPVLPSQSSKGYFRVSFSLKMLASQLLAEITYLLRDPPLRYNPFMPGISSPNSTAQNTPRPSNIMGPTDYSHSDNDDTAPTAAATAAAVTLSRSLENPRSSAGSLEPGSIHSRNNSLDVPRNLLIPSDQGSDTSGGEEVHKKSVTLDTPIQIETITPSTPRFPTNLIIPPTTPDPVPSIVIASPTAKQHRFMMRRSSLNPEHVRLKPLTGSFDKQAVNATSPTSYLHRKLSTFKDSFRRARSVVRKTNTRKSAVTKFSSPLLRRKSISTPMSRAGSHKSLCDDPLCNNLPWVNVVARLYHCDMLKDGILLSSYKTCCAELEGALRRLYTLPSPTANDDITAERDKRRFTLSPSSDDPTFPHSFSISRSEKALSISSSSSFASSGTFSLNRFSRSSLNFPFPFGRKHSQLTTHRDTITVQEARVLSSPNKSMLFTEELFGENIEGALEKHAVMLQNRRIKDNDDRKIKYLNKEVKGLLHTPFTILQLAVAANLIDATKLIDLREICWDLLLDTNQELGQSAAMTFLWTVEKSKTHEFNGFFNQNVVIESSISTKLKSITRYMVLWRNRHNGSLNEKDALRRIKMKNSSIGYALPSPLLGAPLSDIPVSPWESYTICSADNCKDNSAHCHKPTRLVPKLYHLKELKILSQPFIISEVSVAKKSAQDWLRSSADTDSATVAMATDAATVPTSSQTALFPSSLLCFLQFLIDSVTITDSATEPLPPPYPNQTESTTVPCTSVSDAARTALWTCMVEDCHLFFQPFLECFKRENMTKPSHDQFPVDLTNHQQLENVLHSLRCLLLAFPTLPTEAAQYLFNHLIAVVMQHKLQPYNCSSVVISEVLVLLRAVTVSVKGLDCKVLKNVLKKEKCYNTVMTTANLQVVQGINFYVKVKCVTDHHLPMSESFPVSATMTFRELMSAAIKKFRHLMSDSFKWDNCILIDDSTKQPMLDDLFIQDHYYSSVRDNQSEGNRYIVFRLQQSNRADKMYFERRSLFWYKMGELSRVVFSIKMLEGSSTQLPIDAKATAISLPSYEFMHNELAELGSFPRKALDNVLHLNGQMSPSIELRITDIMLKGVWICFVFTLFQKMPESYAWSHEMLLFISVVTGSLFLYADDTIILSSCLSTLLLAAVKFNDIFRQRGYNTVVPVLAQVYTLHHHNKVVLQAIEHIWGKFYLLNDNVFVMQAVTSLAALLCSRTNSLEGNTQLNITKPTDSFVSDFPSNEIHQRARSVKAIFQLIKSLRYDQPDILDIEARIGRPIIKQTSQHPQSPTSSAQQEFLYTVFDLCIAVAGAHPDSLRGMQMMVFLDHHISLFLHEFDQLNDGHNERWNKHIIGIRALVKGAENLIKVFRMQQKRGVTSAAATGLTTSVFHQDSNAAPLTSTFAALLQRLTRLNTAIKSAMAKREEVNSGHEGYRRELMEAQWKRTRISSLCLLSLCSKFVHHLMPALKRNFSRYSNTVQMLTELFNSEVKLLITASEKLTLENRGLTLFMTHFLPSLSWAEERCPYPAFTSVLKILGKLFRKYQTDPPDKEAWEVIVRWMGGITNCLRARELAVIQSKTVKMFIDNITGNGLPADVSISERYLESWPWGFSRSLVLMIYQMITHGIDSFSNYLIDVIEGKSLFIKTILIPFCIEYGQHDCLKCPKLMQNILEIIERHLRSAKQIQCALQALRAFALSFIDQIEFVDWHRISILLTYVVQKKFTLPCLTTTLHAPVPIRSFKPSLETLKFIIEFCTPFLSSYQTSLGLLLKRLLTQVESKLQLLQPLCTQEPMMSELAKVIDNCRTVKSHSPLIKQFNKTVFLTKLETELIAEATTDCNPQIQAMAVSETAKSKFAKRKRNRLKANSSFKGESGLELIKEDITDQEQCSPVERLSPCAMEQHRRSPRRMKRRGKTTSDSDDDYDDDDDIIKEILPQVSRGFPPPAASKKRTRTAKSRLLMALHNQSAEEYDGDYEDEIPTPAAVSFNIPDKVFDYTAESKSTTLVEVHNCSVKRSRSSDSSVEASTDNTCLIPETTTSATRKSSFDRLSVSSPNIMYSLMEPLRHSNNSLKQLKVVLLKGHGSSYESTV